MTAYVRLWPPELGRAKQRFWRTRGLLSAVGQRLLRSPRSPREATVFFVFSRFGKFTTTGRDACSAGYRGSILSAFGQGTPPNSLRDLWRTSDLKGGVVSAQDRLCPSLAARRSRKQAAPWAGQERFCPPLTSAVLVRWQPGRRPEPVRKRWLELSGARGPTFIALQSSRHFFWAPARHNYSRNPLPINRLRRVSLVAAMSLTVVSLYER
jgi:hypothetical protein